MNKNKLHPFLRLSLACCAFLLVASVASSQAGRGGINGTVTDPTGAVVAGAKVTALNRATGFLRPP